MTLLFSRSDSRARDTAERPSSRRSRRARDPNRVPRRTDPTDYDEQNRRLQETFPASDPVGRY